MYQAALLFVPRDSRICLPAGGRCPLILQAQVLMTAKEAVVAAGAMFLAEPGRPGALTAQYRDFVSEFADRIGLMLMFSVKSAEDAINLFDGFRGKETESCGDVDGFGFQNPNPQEPVWLLDPRRQLEARSVLSMLSARLSIFGFDDAAATIALQYVVGLGLAK